LLDSEALQSVVTDRVREATQTNDEAFNRTTVRAIELAGENLPGNVQPRDFIRAERGGIAQDRKQL